MRAKSNIVPQGVSSTSPDVISVQHSGVRRDSEIATDPTLWQTKRIFLCIAVLSMLYYIIQFSAAIRIEYVGFGLPAVQAGLKTENEEQQSEARKRANAEAMEAVAQTKTQVFKNAAPDYIKRYAAVAVQEMNAYGIPASISLAQGLIESRAGTSKLALQNCNHFGIKCFSRNCKRGHCTNFTDDTHKDFFLKFSSPWESWRAHSKLLSGPRYKSLRGQNWQAWADGLQNLGYATDNSYSAALKRIVQEYGLQKFDDLKYGWSN